MLGGAISLALSKLALVSGGKLMASDLVPSASAPRRCQNVGESPVVVMDAAKTLQRATIEMCMCKRYNKRAYLASLCFFQPVVAEDGQLCRGQAMTS